MANSSCFLSCSLMNATNRVKTDHGAVSEYKHNITFRFVTCLYLQYTHTSNFVQASEGQE